MNRRERPEGMVTVSGQFSRAGCASRRVIGLGFAIIGLLLAAPRPAPGAVSDITFSDVTTRAFAVVWASDEPVSDATVRVFADADGFSDITSSLSVSLTSASFSPALLLGVIRVDVSGLPPSTCVFVQTATTAAGLVLQPDGAPFLEVCTAAETAKANALDAPISNDLIRHQLLAPDAATPAPGTLLLVSAPGTSAYPLSAFAGGGFSSPDAVADLNNFFDASTGISAEVVGGEVLQLREFRGLMCPALQDHQLLRFRRAPPHEEEVTLGRRITEIEDPEPCFFADTVCDDTVDILDVQRLLNVFLSAFGECAFNPDLDIVPDGTINILDFQSVLNRFGESAPFN